MKLKNYVKMYMAIAMFLFGMFCLTNVSGQGLTRLSKKYHYVQGETHDQFLPTLLYDNGISSPSVSSPHIQVWTIFLPAIKGGKISQKKGYYFTFYIKKTGGEDSFDDVYNALFGYRYTEKGDYFSAKGTKVPRVIRNEMITSGVTEEVVKQLRKDKFRYATEYLAHMGEITTGAKISDQDTKPK